MTRTKRLLSLSVFLFILWPLVLFASTVPTLDKNIYHSWEEVEDYLEAIASFDFDAFTSEETTFDFTT